MKILFFSVLKLLLVFDILSGQQINFGFISQNPIQKYPNEVYYDTPEADVYGASYVYKYDNTNPSSKPGFFFNYIYNRSGYYLSLGYESIGSKDGIIDRTRDRYEDGLPYFSPSWSSYASRERTIINWKEFTLSQFSLSINKEFMLNDASSLLGLSGLPDFTNDISLYVGLKAVVLNAGELKYQSTYYEYDLASIDTSTSTGNYVLDNINEDDDRTSDDLSDLKPSPAILLGISYKFMPKFKIFAEYSTPTVKNEWTYYNDSDDEKKVYSGSGSFSLGITYDLRLSPEKKAAKMEEKEAKQKAKREKLKKELENF